MGMISANRYCACLGLCSGLLLLLSAPPQPAAQDQPSRFRVNVDLVQLNVAVTDRKGNYIAGLRPEDFTITEDKLPEKIATFEEGTESARKHALQNAGKSPDQDQQGPALASADGKTSLIAGANVFILFDTSDYMYRGFVFAQDAVANFIRSMDDANKIAFYSYSRDLSRATTLTTDRFRVVNGVRNTVAGDQAALYNCMLLTVEDAAPLKGRKAIVVFSNGPDNASSVPPEDVAELAQSTGTIIYMISTQQAESQPISTAVFERMSKATGGKAYFSKDWKDEKQAFASIRDDLAHLYAISYYPAPNSNHGWRNISVKLVGKNLQKYHIRTRAGYRLLQTTQASAAPESESASK